ncbi:ATP-binding protein [Dactylosporangium roseum]|uniref:ATP-binding protein n=1 Tax=Dactylosporangium roseum TaxID=47989 RepID=A0ABY5ZAI7_9ACTN|nr:ATP-binding protein [Dactylosporangium roseum]UWZ38497.1 ATP-binding protein [Dactylosporangium roseum]
MLLKFRLQNYRSVRDVQELTTLLAETRSPHGGFPVRFAHGGAVRVSPLVGVFGANASGKSTVLRALGSLRALAAAGSDAREAARRFEPFQLDPAARLLPTRFEVEFVLDGIRYVYGCAYKSGEIAGEWLHAHGRDRRRVWFERDRHTTRCLPEAGLDRLAAAVDPETTLLAFGADAEHPWLAPIAQWLGGLRRVRIAAGARLVADLDRLAARWSDQLTLLLTRADLGISGVDTSTSTLRLIHEGRSGPQPLGAYVESDGTIAWLDLLIELLHALDHGGVLLIDDLDAILHPVLLTEALRLLRDRDLNPARAQLIFTARSVPPAAEGAEVLEPDQCWYAVKGADGATSLVREGRAPEIGPGELARELWLAKQRLRP